MQSRRAARDARRVRRWIGAVVCLAALAIASLVIPRLAPRSPIAIVVLCTLAVLTMKLVERRVHQWFRRWGEREGARTMRPRGQPERGNRTPGGGSSCGG